MRWKDNMEGDNGMGSGKMVGRWEEDDRPKLSGVGWGEDGRRNEVEKGGWRHGGRRVDMHEVDGRVSDAAAALGGTDVR